MEREIKLGLDLYQILATNTNEYSLYRRIWESLKAEEERLEHLKEDRMITMTKNKETMRKFLDSKK